MLSTLALAALVSQPRHETITLDVDGTARTAILYRPQSLTSNTPIVYAWHGMGGRAESAAASFRIHDAWPQAIVVYPQGLSIQKQGNGRARTGWSLVATNSNRDLRFFDVLDRTVHSLTNSHDRPRFSMGHSNGGFFSLVLWQTKPNLFRAFGPSASSGAENRVTTSKPAFVIACRNDTVVNSAKQESSAQWIVKINGGDFQHGQSVGPHFTHYPGTSPTAVWRSPDGHKFAKDAVPAMIQFFKAQL